MLGRAAGERAAAVYHGKRPKGGKGRKGLGKDNNLCLCVALCTPVCFAVYLLVLACIWGVLT